MESFWAVFLAPWLHLKVWFWKNPWDSLRKTPNKTIFGVNTIVITLRKKVYNNLLDITKSGWVGLEFNNPHLFFSNQQKPWKPMKGFLLKVWLLQAGAQTCGFSWCPFHGFYLALPGPVKCCPGNLQIFRFHFGVPSRDSPWVRRHLSPTKIEWDLTNGPQVSCQSY